MKPHILSSLIFIVVVVLFGFETKDCVKENSTLNHVENEEGSRVLSRRKRFVIFPEGSSLQLVFCLQTAAIIPIGDIFLYGNTVSLAWNLPTDTKYLSMFKGFKDAQRRGDITKRIVYYDEGGKIVQEVPYKRKPIINPAIAKRSVTEQRAKSYKEKLKIKLEHMRTHELEQSRDYLTRQHLDRASIDYHRRNRVELYGRIEKFLDALGRDGKSCVLHKLCTTARRGGEQGTFQQEFLRAVFTLPKGTQFDDQNHQEYDEAHDESLDCNKKYTGCLEIDIKF